MWERWQIGSTGSSFDGSMHKCMPEGKVTVGMDSITNWVQLSINRNKIAWYKDMQDPTFQKDILWERATCTVVMYLVEVKLTIISKQPGKFD